MRTAKMILSVLLAGSLMGCATGQSAREEPSKVIIESESPEKYEAKDDALLEKMKELEQSISVLRSEVANLGYRLSHWASP